jgi:hypothetical protein
MAALSEANYHALAAHEALQPADTACLVLSAHGCSLRAFHRTSGVQSGLPMYALCRAR